MNPIHNFNFQLYISKINSNIIPHLSLGCTSSHFRSHFPAKILYTLLISLMRTTCPSHLILLYLIIPVLFGEVYKLWSSSFCSLLQPPPTSFLLGPNIFLSALFLHTLSIYAPPLVWENNFHIYTKQQVKFYFRAQSVVVLLYQS